MKKALCIVVILTLMLATGACSAGGNESDPTAVETLAPAPTQGETEPSGVDVVGDELTLGMLYQLIGEGEEIVIDGASLSGNQAGTSGKKKSVNNKPTSTSELRFIFELNEWISVNLDTEAEGLTVYCMPHQDEAQTEIDKYANELNDIFPAADLTAPEDKDDKEASWGELCVSPDDFRPGYYDLVFAIGPKPVARIIIKLYNEGELADKSDKELNKLMKDELNSLVSK